MNPFYKTLKYLIIYSIGFFIASCSGSKDMDYPTDNKDLMLENKINKLLSEMTMKEKIGQLQQMNGSGKDVQKAIREGLVGSVLNEINKETLNKLQKIAIEESRLGIPLIIGRDVIHGYKTIFPIPLGQAASWNPGLIEKGAHIAATEARSQGIHWTFAPMIDIARDPRWGRIAESLGEDPYLTSQLGAAMVKGFQGEDMSANDRIAACAKHFVGYGAAEGGRDYNTANIPLNQLREVYLPPFREAVKANVASFMTSFNEVNGIPSSANKFLFKEVLRNEWGFNGFVVSDWESIKEMIDHGYSSNYKEAAKAAFNAGVDMEMVSTSYQNHIEELINENEVLEKQLNESVKNILRIKFKLGLFENPYIKESQTSKHLIKEHLEAAKKAALQSMVLLKNENNTLPISNKVQSIAVIGPLADAPHEQLGTWVFDGDKKDTNTPLNAIKSFAGNKIKINYVKGLDFSRDKNSKSFSKALYTAKKSDLVLMFVGEESILSGEAHSRANLDLPGEQNKLIETIAQSGKPIVLIVLAGRPLTIGNISRKVNAVLYAWHPGTMGGEAIVDLLFGKESPSGKLPVTFPKAVGQIPIYYSHKNTGRPASANTFVSMKDIPIEAPQTSLGNTSHYLDLGFTPLFPFGYGLSYTSFEYSNLKTSEKKIKKGEIIQVSAVLKNTGKYESDEIVQLYTRDLFASTTRPIKELKGFQRIRLKPNESKEITFELNTNDLSFYHPEKGWITEAGEFKIWIGGSSEAQLNNHFEVVD